MTHRQHAPYSAIARAMDAAHKLPPPPAGQPAYIPCPACKGRIRITARQGATEGRCNTARCPVRWPH